MDTKRLLRGIVVRRLVHGVGINDSDYQTNITEWVEGKQRLIWRCPYYVKWKGMLRRCYSADSYKTYLSSKVVVTEDWLRFSSFRKWVLAQGVSEQDLSNYDLDKDLLGKNNIYSPATCTLVPHVINTFILDKSNTDSPYPTGVYLSRNKFIARCNNPITKKREILGYYDCPEKAHYSWRKRKLEILKELQTIYNLDNLLFERIAEKYS